MHIAIHSHSSLPSGRKRTNSTRFFALEHSSCESTSWCIFIFHLCRLTCVVFWQSGNETRAVHFLVVEQENFQAYFLHKSRRVAVFEWGISALITFQSDSPIWSDVDDYAFLWVMKKWACRVLKIFYWVSQNTMNVLLATRLVSKAQNIFVSQLRHLFRVVEWSNIQQKFRFFRCCHFTLLHVIKNSLCESGSTLNWVTDFHQRAFVSSSLHDFSPLTLIFERYHIFFCHWPLPMHAIALFDVNRLRWKFPH